MILYLKINSKNYLKLMVFNLHYLLFMAFVFEVIFNLNFIYFIVIIIIDSKTLIAAININVITEKKIINF